jgi:excisionase family DNA binding protein
MGVATLYLVPAFRIAEAAELLGVSDDTVRRWVDSRRLPVDRDQSRRKVIDGAILGTFAQEQGSSRTGLMPGQPLSPQPLRRARHHRHHRHRDDPNRTPVRTTPRGLADEYRGSPRARPDTWLTSRGRSEVHPSARGDPGQTTQSHAARPISYWAPLAPKASASRVPWCAPDGSPAPMG